MRAVPWKKSEVSYSHRKFSFLLVFYIRTPSYICSLFMGRLYRRVTRTKPWQASQEKVSQKNILEEKKCLLKNIKTFFSFPNLILAYNWPHDAWCSFIWWPLKEVVSISHIWLESWDLIVNSALNNRPITRTQCWEAVYIRFSTAAR